MLTVDCFMCSFLAYCWYSTCNRLCFRSFNFTFDAYWKQVNIEINQKHLLWSDRLKRLNTCFANFWALYRTHGLLFRQSFLTKFSFLKVRLAKSAWCTRHIAQKLVNIVKQLWIDTGDPQPRWQKLDPLHWGKKNVRPIWGEINPCISSGSKNTHFKGLWC